MTLSPAEELDVVDNVPCRKELEALGVAWPQCVVFGMLDAVMLAEFGPLYKIRITLDDAAYHEVDSSETPSVRQVALQDVRLSRRRRGID